MLPLKQATQSKHHQAEKMPFNEMMFSGQMSKNHYLLYLVQQLQIFQTIENTALPHKNLARGRHIQQDIDELVAQDIHANTILDSTHEYVKYLSGLSYTDLLPHIYLNYLALMYGGQMMKKKVPSSGKMYDFENMQEAMQSIRLVQKDEWADEVNKGFDFTINLFEELENVRIHDSLNATA